MKKILVFLLMITVVLHSCTKDFEELNTDTTRPTPDKADANALFGSAVSNGLMQAFEMQRVQALYPDLYSEYFAKTESFVTWLSFSFKKYYYYIVEHYTDRA